MNSGPLLFAEKTKKELIEEILRLQKENEKLRQALEAKEKYKDRSILVYTGASHVVNYYFLSGDKLLSGNLGLKNILSNLFKGKIRLLGIIMQRNRKDFVLSDGRPGYGDLLDYGFILNRK